MKLDEYLDRSDHLEASNISSWRKFKWCVFDFLFTFALPFIFVGLFLRSKIRDRGGDCR